MAALSLLVLAIFAGLAYQAAGAWRDARRFSPRGRLIDIAPHPTAQTTRGGGPGGYRLHAHVSGEGEPAVVLEAGIAASSLSWSLVQPEVARFARVCSYDRGGLAWSDPHRSRRTCAAIVEELRALLVAAPLPPPYVLVGHSFGGFVVRAYADRYPDEVAGLVLVDPIYPGEWMEMSAEQRRRLRGAVFFARVGTVVARIGIVRLALALLTGGAPRASRMFARPFGSEASAVLSRLVGEVRKLPPDVWPLVQAMWCQPKCFSGMAAHLSVLEENARYISRCGTLRDLPLVVISAGRQDRATLSAHAAIARLSTRGRHVVAPDAGHWVHLDAPEIVVDAIREVVQDVRDSDGSHLPRLGVTQ